VCAEKLENVPLNRQPVQSIDNQTHNIQEKIHKS